MNFAKFLRTSFYGTLSDDCSLCLPVILRNFSDHPFYRALLGNCLFHVQVAEFQPPDTVKNCFRDVSMLSKVVLIKIVKKPV